MPASAPLGIKLGPRVYKWMATEHGQLSPSGPM